MLGNPHSTFFASNAAGAETLGNIQRLSEIETTYSLQRVNQAQEQGHEILIVERKQNPELVIKKLLLRNRDTGTYEYASSRRVFAQYGEIIEYPEKEWELVREVSGYGRNRDIADDWGAYIIPNDIVLGEKVYISDLIEDLVACRFWENVWYASDAQAIWTGERLNLDTAAYDSFMKIG